MAVFRFRFASFCLEAKRMAVFCFHFASFRFEAKMMAFFCFFFVLFSLRSIFVSLQISTFRIDAKQAKKALFFASKRKKFHFRFASFRFEAKMTAHPSSSLSAPSMSVTPPPCRLLTGTAFQAGVPAPPVSYCLHSELSFATFPPLLIAAGALHRRGKNEPSVYETLLPGGLFLGRRTQNWLNKNPSGLGNLRERQSHLLTEGVCCLTFFFSGLTFFAGLAQEYVLDLATVVRDTRWTRVGPSA